jgi:hypothetical protein
MATAAPSILKELRENLEILPMSELRKRATTNFGLKLSSTDAKDDIINKIVGIASKANFAEQAKGDIPEPGWSRIRCHPVLGRTLTPFYVGINGYGVWIPYNIDVDVPSKVVGVLRDAKEMRITTDDFGNQTRALEDSYPHSLIFDNPGPDPRPGIEVARERKLKPKRDFADANGFWPKNRDIQEARQAQILKTALHG